MKIRINENETYEIQMKEEMTIQELEALLQRLNGLTKYVARDVFSEALRLSQVPLRQEMKTGKKPITRERVLEFLKAFYSKDVTREERKRLIEENDSLYNKIKMYRERFNITPQEIGLKEFPRAKSSSEAMIKSKEEAVKILDMMYNNPEKFKEFAEEHRKTVQQMKMITYFYKRKFKIPNKHENHIEAKPVSATNNNSSNPNNEAWSREKTVKMLKMLYNDKDEFRKVAKELGKTYESLQAKAYFYKKKYSDIKPKEVGLTEFIRS